MININTGIKPNYINDVAEIKKHLSLDSETVRKLAAIDRGGPGANMTTKGLAFVLKNSESYIFENGRFKISNELYPLDLEEKTSSPEYVETPSFLEIEATWDKTQKNDCDNVFGDTVRLFVNEKSLTLPVVKAADETLAYYGAAVIPKGAPVRFPGKEFPVFFMEFGENWLEGGVQTEQFGGVFLEYHNDQPHFHMAYEKGSYYILARWSDKTKSRLQITAFELNPGEGIYTRKGAIHSDNAVRGNLLIGYHITEDFSVAFIRNNPSDDKRVNIQFDRLAD